MVNPVKFLSRATGISNLIDRPETPAPQAVAAATTPTSPPPQAAPLVGAEPAPRRQNKGPRQFAPSIIGSGATADSGGVGGKTLLGQ